MRTRSDSLADVLRSLPALRVRSLDIVRAGQEVDALVAAGRRTGQLRARVVRPPCSPCDGEGSCFVSREVHLCPSCVAVPATGEARLAATGEAGLASTRLTG